MFDTGPGVGTSVAGIRVNRGVDVIGNTVIGVELDTDLSDRTVRGIDAATNGAARLQDNTVRDVIVTNGNGVLAFGIVTGGGHADVTGNSIANTFLGIGCVDGTGMIHGNRASGVIQMGFNCDDDGGNIVRTYDQ